jgi:hypothetical protein
MTGTPPVSRATVSPVSLPLKGLARDRALWTETEDDVLILRHQARLDYAWAARKTGRSVRACRKRAFKLGAVDRIRLRPSKPAKAGASA